MKNLIGAGVALITPFTKNNTVDVNTLTKLVEYTISNGIDYLVALGTTAESSVLSRVEKELAKKTIIEVNGGRVPLVLGLGGNDTEALRQEFIKTDFSNFDAILSVSPYYNKPSQAGIFSHYKILDSVTRLPIILYNVPSRTSSNIAIDTVCRLADECKNIIAIKEASGDYLQALELIHKLPKSFLVISGDDLMALPITLAGGKGVISVMANAYPEKTTTMIKHALNNNAFIANEFFYELLDGINLIFEEGNPTGIKALLAQLGIGNGIPRLPNVKATPSLITNLKEFLLKNK